MYGSNVDSLNSMPEQFPKVCF